MYYVGSSYIIRCDYSLVYNWSWCVITYIIIKDLKKKVEGGFLIHWNLNNIRISSLCRGRLVFQAGIVLQVIVQVPFKFRDVSFSWTYLKDEFLFFFIVNDYYFLTWLLNTKNMDNYWVKEEKWQVLFPIGLGNTNIGMWSWGTRRLNNVYCIVPLKLDSVVVSVCYIIFVCLMPRSPMVFSFSFFMLCISSGEQRRFV